MILESNELNFLILHDGEDGIPGDGTIIPSYTWVKYSKNADGSNLTDDPTDAKYIGIAYNKSDRNESTNKADYEWILIKGSDGKDAYTIILQNENISFSTNQSRTPFSPQSHSCKVIVMQGATPRTDFTIGKINSVIGITTSITDNTIILYADNSTPIGSDSGSIEIPIIIDEHTFIKTITYSVSKAGLDGNNGVSVQSIDVMYYQSNSSTELSGGEWSTTAPEWINGKYIWSKTITTYSSGSPSESKPVCITGEKGSDGNDGTNVTVKTTSVEYQAGTSGTEQPTGAWLTDIPEVSEGNYLWSKTTVVFSDDSKTVTYSVSKSGVDGINGESFYTWIKYADSPTSGMSDSATGKSYIGIAYNKTTPTESTSYNDYIWSLIKGSDGEDGETYYTWIKYANTPTSGMSDTPEGKEYIGIAYNKTTATPSTNYNDYTWSLVKGADGKGITTTVIEYQKSNSGTDIPSTWTSSIPKVEAGQYLWTKVTTNYTIGESSISYSVGMMGATGATGTGIESITEEYYLSTSKTSQTGGEWKEIPDAWEKGKYMWTRSKIVYTNPSSIKYTTPVCDSSWEAANDVQNSLDNQIKTITETISSVSFKVDENEKSITERIEQVTKIIEKKADGTAVEEIEERITNVEETADGIISEVSKTNKRIDDINIGARNLFVSSYCTREGNTKDGYQVALWGNEFVSNDNLIKMLNPSTEYTIQYKFKLLTLKENSVPYNGDRHGTLWLLGGTQIRLCDETINTIEEAKLWQVGTVVQRSLTFTTPSDLHDEDIGYNIGAYSRNSCDNPSTFGKTETGLFYDIKIEKGNIKTDFTPAPEDDLEIIEEVRTIAEQTANKFSWVVKSGTNETNFTLTDRTATLVSDYINLNGLVSFNGLNSDTKDKINGIDSNAQTAIANAKAAKEYAEGVNTTANDAKTKAESANSIIANWCYNNDTTYINGGDIYTGTITSKQLNTDAIKSNNYSYSSGKFSTAGTFLNLTNGAFTSKNFAIDSSGNAYFNGSITLGQVSDWSTKESSINSNISSAKNEAINTAKTNSESYTDGKISALPNVAKTGNYNDLSNKPTIPTSVSDLGLDTSTIIFKGNIVQTTKTDANGIQYLETSVPTSNGKITYSTYDADDYIVFGRSKGTNSSGENYVCVSKEGLLTARNAIIYGTINATAGVIGGCNIENGVLKVPIANITGTLAIGNINGLQNTIDNLNGIISDLEDVNEGLNREIGNHAGILADWCYNNDTTYIDGGNIYAGTISAKLLNSECLTSFNYVNNPDSVFSNSGTKIYLGDSINGTITPGYIKSQNFAITSSGDVYFKGNIEAVSGRIANWEIDNDNLKSVKVGVVTNPTYHPIYKAFISSNFYGENSEILSDMNQKDYEDDMEEGYLPSTGSESFLPIIALYTKNYFSDGSSNITSEDQLTTEQLETIDKNFVLYGNGRLVLQNNRFEFVDSKFIAKSSDGFFQIQDGILRGCHKEEWVDVVDSEIDLSASYSDGYKLTIKNENGIYLQSKDIVIHSTEEEHTYVTVDGIIEATELKVMTDIACDGITCGDLNSLTAEISSLTSDSISCSSISSDTASFSESISVKKGIQQVGINLVNSENDTTSTWFQYNTSVHYYNSSGTLKSKPTTQGYLLNYAGPQNVHQIWLGQSNGSMYHRSGNSTGWGGSASGTGAWKTILDSSNYTSVVDTLTNDDYGVKMHHNNNNNYTFISVSSSSGGGIDDKVYLGTSTFRWKNIYATNGTIQTSDANEKHVVENISNSYEEMFMKLRPVTYMWRNLSKDNAHIHDRVHCGLIAQEVNEAAESVGLSSITFAAICRDDLEEPTFDGRTERWGINYSELHGLEIHMIQKTILHQAEQDEKIALLEREIEQLKTTISQLIENLNK